ncbi:MAG: HAMP domain-containing histidine kinase [Defluviitaleaceae bacterium]|nr:HAMP domain-containing histidine kinase [Defluviitaleaceae bacterium]
MKKHLSIWASFVAFVFVILFATIMLVIGLYLVVIHIGLEDTPRWSSFHTILFILLISVVFGTIASAVASRKFMRFVYDLKNATQRVATGDFTVRIAEDYKISEINSLLRDFNKMAKDLGSIQTLKDDFVTSVSHEIKTPIAAIEGCVELLKEQTLTTEERNEYVNLIEISVKRLSVLTANILRLSKLDNQEILPDQVEFSLDEQVRQAILLLEHQWSAKDINLNIYLTPVRIVANKELLMQVWINLLDNAIKFSHPAGDINVELSAVDGRVYVKVTDFGIGMQAGTIKHIFQKFYQGNESRSNQGNGLGLALVKRIVELSGGTIAVESRVGKGSVFTVELPGV